MKYLGKLWVRIVAAIVLGLLVAGALTKITYPCTTTYGLAACVSFEKAVMHPADLLSNKQNSLVDFSRTFALASLTTFAIASAINLAQNRKSNGTKAS